MFITGFAIGFFTALLLLYFIRHEVEKVVDGERLYSNSKNKKRGQEMNIILSIHPKWAKLIYDGKKTIEWRKSFPKAQKINKVFLYETAPVKQITGFFTLGEIGCYLVSSVCAQPCDFIERGCVPMTDLIKYRENVDCIFGWIIDKAKKFTKPQNIDDFSLKRPPQSWCYTEVDV